MQVRQYRVEGRASPLAEGLRRFRSAALERLKAVCPEQEAGYLAALLLGDKHALSEDFYDLYRKNGIAHLLAISGLHTGFLGLALYRLLRKKCGLSLSAVVTALFLCLYAALTGGDTGVLRSSLERCRLCPSVSSFPLAAATLSVRLSTLFSRGLFNRRSR